MNPKIKESWCTALRSGQYLQGQNSLLREDKFCCLGVLADLYAKENGVKWGNEGIFLSEGEKSMHGENSVLPRQVVEWAELKVPNPILKNHTIYFNSLAEINDGESSFQQIADLIEIEL